MKKTTLLHPIRALGGPALAACMVAVLLAAAGTPAHAAECKESANAKISGVITEVEKNEKGEISFDVEAVKPCNVEAVFIQGSSYPNTCRPGARFSATGEIEVVFGVYMFAKSISCR